MKRKKATLPPFRRKRRKWPFVAGALLLLLLINVIQYPICTSYFQAVQADAGQVASFELSHNGKTYDIDQPSDITALCAMLDTPLNRGQSDYLFYSEPGDSWTLCLIRSDGSRTVHVQLFPGATSGGPSSIKFGHYTYACQQPFDDTLLQQLADTYAPPHS
ncbi:MAG: hypothetical protein ACLUUJ_01410 [Acutalibacteraceae bacterium]|nr:hypothetical protein [Bacillota bacterium]